jgi:hypothetical protein
MDVSGGVDNENRNVIMWNKHNGLNQQWDIIYVDEMKPEPKKGELNTDFNFIVDRPFHIQSMMKSGRYLDRVGNNVVLKTPNGRDTQVWYFHQYSRTIRNKYQNYSFNIDGNGRSNNLGVTSTNSNWW